MANPDSTPILAVVYLRKSTNGKDADGRERQEKSIEQQRRETEALERQHGYKIVRWYKDEGFSGWKRNGERPDFDRMLRDAKEKGDFQAVLCDDLDRFSRAEVMEVISDLSTLAAGGVKIVHCVNQGRYSLGDNDIGKIIKMVVDIHGGNEFSRKLARRIALARRNAAKLGRRSGGCSPYGLRSDGETVDGRWVPNGLLVHGDPEHVKVVRWIFDAFVNQRMTLNGLAAALNEQGVPSSKKGGKWYPPTVTGLLRQRAYRGDFVFNQRKCGQFFIIDENQEVVEASNRKCSPSQETDEGVFIVEGVYEPLIEPALFDKAQKKLDSFKGGKRRPRYGGSPLAGVLYCDHCGLPMYREKSRRIYRCTSNAKVGNGSCGNYQVKEAEILPFILRMLSEEIDDLMKLRTDCPDDLIQSHEDRSKQAEGLERQAAALQAKIDKAEDRLLDIDDKRTRRSLDQKISAMRDELDRLNAELSNQSSDGDSLYSADDLQKLAEWHESFIKRAVSIPLNPDEFPDSAAYHTAWGDSTTFGMKVDVTAVNDALHELGAEVRLRWRTEQWTSSTGRIHPQHVLDRGRFRLGQRNGELRTLLSTAGGPEHRAVIFEGDMGMKGIRGVERAS